MGIYHIIRYLYNIFIHITLIIFIYKKTKIQPPYTFSQ